MTQYDVVVGGVIREHVRNKTQAIRDAVRARNKERTAVQVVTEKGTVVYEKPAPKRIRQSPKYSRVVPLPDGVAVPDTAFRVAYVRPRANGAILHSNKDGKYRLMKLDTGELLPAKYPTAGSAGDVLSKSRL